ncbi:MAG: hypothetical protein HXX16_20580 [Bacteroidales bacterium]|nr:hypothetical protein [Bacteroidales bacterium]
MKIIIFLSLIVLFAACRQDSQSIGKQAIINISRNYQSTGFLNNIDKFEISERLINKYKVEIQLWKIPNDDEDKNVVVFINNKTGYAIPILPNIYKKFWNFQFDDNQTDTSRINKTFQEEFSRMLQRLGLIDSIQIASKCLFDLFNTILDSRLIHESDSADIMSEITNSNIDLGENDSIYDTRKTKIINVVLKNIRIAPNCFHYNANWDQKNNRIYQVNLDSIRTNTRFQPELKVYRLDCNRRAWIKI